MTGAYDPDLIARLVVAAKEDDARMTPRPWTSETVCTHRDYGLISGPSWPVAGVCFDDDRRPVTSEFDPGQCVIEDIHGIARTRNNLRAMADQLEAARARIVELEAAHAHAREAYRHLEALSFSIGDVIGADDVQLLVRHLNELRAASESKP